MKPSLVRTAVILNPHASSAEASAELVREHAERAGWHVMVCERPGDTTRFAHEAVAAGVELVLAAGGDGTVSEVVNGLMGCAARPTFGVLPLGTGNDFARTLQMPLDVGEACRWLADNDVPTGHTDVLSIRSNRSHSWALTCVNGGIASAITAALDEERKARWGPLAFTIAALEVAGDEVPTWSLELSVDGGPMRRLDGVVSVVAANAPSVGGGFRLAPDADIEDGHLDLVVIFGENALEMLNIALRTKLGFIQGSEQVEHRRARRVDLRVPADFAFTVDGETFEGQSVSIEAEQAALPIVHGPGYRSHLAAG